MLDCRETLLLHGYILNICNKNFYVWLILADPSRNLPSLVGMWGERWGYATFGGIFENERVMRVFWGGLNDSGVGFS